MSEVAAALKAAGQPPLGSPVSAGGPLYGLRTRGLKAKARLNSRRSPGTDATPPPAPQPRAATVSRWQAGRAPRRLSDQDKRAGARRLRERMTRIEQKLRRADTLRPHARAKLEEELAAARRLLARWNDTR